MSTSCKPSILCSVPLPDYTPPGGGLVSHADLALLSDGTAMVVPEWTWRLFHPRASADVRRTAPAEYVYHLNCLPKTAWTVVVLRALISACSKADKLPLVPRVVRTTPRNDHNPITGGHTANCVCGVLGLTADQLKELRPWSNSPKAQAVPACGRDPDPACAACKSTGCKPIGYIFESQRKNDNLWISPATLPQGWPATEETFEIPIWKAKVSLEIPIWLALPLRDGTAWPIPPDSWIESRAPLAGWDLWVLAKTEAVFGKDEPEPADSC